LIGLAIAAALVVAGCSGGSAADPSDVTFDMSLIEIKGATDGISAPDIDPATLSQGYRYSPPGAFDAENPAKFQVSSYIFSPGAMAATVGDDVTLRMFGVNGDEHAIVVTAPDGSTAVPSFVVNRGREVSVNFEASVAGHYKVLCATHGPTMAADIFVS
jgi:plastocyanin